ncbi:major facilitator transporter [Streptomyces cyaneogriseus subsp. noncyanogenus]|uniref:Major facilitator transporter n=1 Tax=Streptomyces cyaneogriseus subsp. noncyanogenus TaxID=477245 RepID=A0A0C5FZ30_9ACTN|nr:major facilitator transporter [Streptomyces cyaneogriseus subsp. noncyanogenus]
MNGETRTGGPQGRGDGGERADDGGRPDPNRWRALWVTLVAGFMTLLDVTIVAVALPSLQRDLHASAASVQWVVSGYTLAFALTLVTAGRLGDAFGRRRLFLAALAAFVLCSAAAGAAPTVTLLVVARLAQGVAAGSLAPQNSALIQQMFHGAERARAFGLFGATVGISSAVGPVAGGLILALADGPQGWRWIFYVNVPVGVLALLLGSRLLPRAGPRHRGRLDPGGVVLLGAGILALMLPLVLAEAGGLGRLWWLFPAGALILAAFVAWERRLAARDGAPLLEPRLLTATRGYAAGAGLATLYFVGFSGVWLVLALFFQNGLGYSPLASGLAVTPFAVGSAIAAAAAGRLVGRLGRLLTVWGLVAVMAGLGGTALTLWLAPADRAVWITLPLLFAGGLGSGCVISPNITMTLRNVPVRMAGAAGGALQTGQRLGAAVGTAALPGLFHLALHATDDDYHRAVAIAVGSGAAAMLCALAVAVADRRRDRPGDGPDPAPRRSHGHSRADHADHTR